MNTIEFIHKIATECDKHNVEIIISPKERVHYQTITCNGFFEPFYPVELKSEYILGKLSHDIKFSGKTKIVLAASTGGKTDAEFMSLLAHEYCHMTQYVENSKLWVSAEDFNLFEEWLSGTSVSYKGLFDAWEKIVKLEADCEMRVVKLIGELGLPLDIAEYSRRANSYLFFYHWVLENKKWYKTAPYEVESILTLMPDTLFETVDEYIAVGAVTSEIMTAFDACL